MTKYFKVPFAETGDRDVIPESSESGEVSFETGYTEDYELPKTSLNRKAIERAKNNGLYHAITENLKFWQENGAPEIVADDGTGSPLSYGKGFVGSLGGLTYAAMVDGTTTVPPSAEWEEVDLSTLNQRVRFVGSISDLESLADTALDGDAARLVSGTGRDGDFRWNSSDLSSTLVLASATSDSVDNTTDTINDADHPFSDGDGVITQTTVNGLTAQTVYWVVNSTSGTYQLSATFGGGAVDLTGTANVTIDHLLDPRQGIYVTPTADKTGTSGAWGRMVEGPVNILWFGTAGSGLADDTGPIQGALDYAGGREIWFPEGQYLIDVLGPNYAPGNEYQGGIHPRSNSTLRFSKNATLVMTPNDKPSYVMVNIREDDITIHNGHCIGDIEAHTDTGGEFGFGFFVRAAKNPRLFNCVAEKFWGDGFIVSDENGTMSPVTEGGGLYYCTSKDNRRQGLSITSWKGGLVLAGEYKDTGRLGHASPAFGIDIEPNPGMLGRIDVTLIDVKTSGNFRGGLAIVPGFMTDPSITDVRDFNVRVIGFTSEDDAVLFPTLGTGAGISLAYPVIDGTDTDITKQVYGSITLENIKISGSGFEGLKISRWPDTAPEVHIKGLDIFNCYSRSDTGVDNHLKCAISQKTATTTNKIAQTGKVTIDDFGCYDSRSTKKMLAPVWMEVDDAASELIANVSLKNYRGELGTSTDSYHARLLESVDCDIYYDDKPVVSRSSSKTINDSEHAGAVLYFTSTTSLILPAIADVEGLKFYIQAAPDVTVVTTPSGSDTVHIGGLIDSEIGIVSGGLVCLEAKSDGWHVSDGEAMCYPRTYSVQPFRVIYGGSTPPASGTWKVGDTIYYTPSSGGRVGAKCRTAGTPGTWVEFGTFDA